MRRKLDAVERKHVVVFPRHVPWHVRLVKANGEKERLFLLPGELLDGEARDAPIDEFVIGAIERRELDSAHAGVLAWLWPGVAALGPPDFVPLRAIPDAAMINLARRQ